MFITSPHFYPHQILWKTVENLYISYLYYIFFIVWLWIKKLSTFLLWIYPQLSLKIRVRLNKGDFLWSTGMNNI